MRDEEKSVVISVPLCNIWEMDQNTAKNGSRGGMGRQTDCAILKISLT